MLKWTAILAVLAVLALVAVVAWPKPAPAAGPPTLDEMTSELMCQCGCGMTVAACAEAMECSVGTGMRTEIVKQIDEGKSKAEILDYFVGIYGEAVLASPRKSGFNLTAWVTPFLAIAMGGAVLAWAAWAWVRRRTPRPSEEPAAVERQDLAPYEELVEQDLKLLE
ncbi:MAG: cytochrome c-type biogenesis protein CcmH [Chloroflexota bacterium]|nr:cytochrome c-type biogenesis protein CcmH [Chloroflexota bacterium]